MSSEPGPAVRDEATIGQHEVGPRHGRDGDRGDEGDVEALERTSIVLRAYASPLPLA